MGAQVPINFKAARLTTIIGVVFVLASGCLSVLTGFEVIGPQRPKGDENFSALNLHAKWKCRRESFIFILSEDFLGALGVIMLLPAFQSLRRILTEKSGTLLQVMYFCFVIGITLPTIEFLQNLGSASASDAISTWDNL